MNDGQRAAGNERLSRAKAPRVTLLRVLGHQPPALPHVQRRWTNGKKTRAGATKCGNWC